MVDAVRVGSGFASLLPIAVSRYRTIYQGAKVAKRCRQELDYLYKDLKIQEGIFLNECRILLKQSGQDDDESGIFAGELAVSEGNAEALEDGLEKYLADRYEDCKAVFERVRQAQDQVLKQLKAFDSVRNGKDEVSRCDDIASQVYADPMRMNPGRRLIVGSKGRLSLRLTSGNAKRESNR